MKDNRIEAESLAKQFLENKSVQLNEAVMGQATQYWPKFSLCDIVKISTYSSDWTSQSMFGSFKKQFPISKVNLLEQLILAQQSWVAELFRKNRLQIQYKDRNPSVPAIGQPAKLLISYKSEKDVDKIDAVIRQFVDGKKLEYGEPVVNRKTVVKKNKADGTQTSTDIVLTSFGISAPGMEKADFEREFKELSGKVKEFDDGSMFFKTTEPVDSIDVKVSGTFFDAYSCFEVLSGKSEKLSTYGALHEQFRDIFAKLKNLQAGPAIQEFQLAFDFDQQLGNAQRWFLNFAYDSIYKKQPKPTAEEINAKAKAAEKAGHPMSDEEIETLVVQAMQPQQVFDIAVQQSWSKDKLDQVVASMRNPEFETVDEFCKYLTETHVETQLNNFSEIWKKQRQSQAAAVTKLFQDAIDNEEEWLKDNAEKAKRTEKVKADEASKWVVRLELREIKNIWQLQYIIDWHGTAEDIEAAAQKKKEITQSEPKHQKASERRMKLFAAAKHLDGQTEIIQTGDWVVAVCRTPKSTAPFGRLKPKVLPGTNKINPDCNLEDWEGITSGNRDIRDDVKTQGIRDGIDDGYGHSFDTLAGEHGQENVKDGHQFCETTWCFTGTLSKNYQWTKTSGDITFFKKYTNGGTRPILVFMDTSRGALYAYAHYTNASGQEIENFLNENEKCDGDSPSAKDPSDALQMKFLEKFKSQHASFTALLAQLNRKYYPDFYPAEEFDGIEYDAYQDKGNQQKPAAGVHKAAFRRLKLFKAAEHLGAQIFRTPKWIAAVCKKDQIQPFGRYKPIASKNDPTMPDPRYNLEDWEGITAEDKKIRDRIDFDACLKYDCVRDGVNDGYGIGFDHLEGHSGQNPQKIKFAESCWCLCGALSGQQAHEWSKYRNVFQQFDSYTAGAGGHVFVLMEMSRGAMYLWAVKQGGTEEIANERDSMDSFQMSKANSCTAQTTWFKTKFLPYHPELEVLVNDLKRRYCRSGNAAAVVDTKALLQRAYSQKCVSNNGTLCIFSVGDALTYAPLMGTKFSRLEVYVKDCSYMFKGMDLTNVDKIDFCGMATRMQGTFENAKLDIIDIIGTENVDTFSECFKHSRLETLTGIDTSSATTCNSMFIGATTQNNGRLKLPKFDLSNCTNIGGMFQNTNIAGVTMVNTGKVQVAVGCYTNCPYLVSYPPTKFDSITDIKQLTGTEELIDMFAGCSSLTNQQMLSKSSAVDFEAELAATAEFYSRPKSLFDSDGYYIVKSSADMNNQFYQKNKTKIDKIKIAGDISIQNGAIGAFKYGTEIYAKTIDLSGVRNASRLLATVSFKRVPVLLGTEQIEHADYMFQGCNSMTIAPALTLPKVKTFNGLYMNCPSLHQLPELTVGCLFSDDIDQLGETEYMFGTDITGMAAHCGEQRIKNFAKKIRKQVTDALVFDVPADGVVKTSEMANQFGQASVFIEKCRKYAPETFAKIKKVLVDTEAQCMFAQLNLPDTDFPPVEFGKPEEWSDISGMFSGAKLKSLKGFSLPAGCTVTNALFSECQIKEGFPMLDFKGVTEANGAFAGTKSDVRWQSVPKMSDVKYANELFAESNILPKKFVFDDLDLNSAILVGKAFAKIDSEFVIKSYFNKNLASAVDMFSGCKGLKSIGVWNVVPQNQCNMAHAFENSGVVEIGAIRMASNSVSAFAGCEDLTKIRLLYADGANDLTTAFNGCRRLVNILWYNIGKNLQGFTANMFANCPLAGLFGISCEKYLKSQYKPVIPKAVDIFQVKR